MTGFLVSATMNSMEQMALRLFAAWTDLQSHMKDYTLIALEGDEATDYAEKGKYADDFILDEYKRIVRNVHGVAFPQVFSDLYKGAKAVRDKLAHMIDFESTKGDQPHRVLTIIRSKGFEKYEDGIWLQHRYREDISEEELAYAINAAKEARKLCNVISRLASAFKQFNPSDDDVWDFDWVPWWDGRWGPPPQADGDWRAPVGRYRHHEKPNAERAYWDPDKHKWHKFNREGKETT